MPWVIFLCEVLFGLVWFSNEEIGKSILIMTGQLGLFGIEEGCLILLLKLRFGIRGVFEEHTVVKISDWVNEYFIRRRFNTEIKNDKDEQIISKLRLEW